MPGLISGHSGVFLFLKIVNFKKNLDINTRLTILKNSMNTSIHLKKFFNTNTSKLFQVPRGVHIPPFENHCSSVSRCVTYMSLVVHLVVGEFDPVEADHLTHPRLPRARRVRVHVEPGCDAGVVRVPGHHPLRAVVHVPAVRSIRRGI